MANYTTNTSMYKLNHTMLRVKDPQASIKYYSENFGMKVINRLDVEEAKFSLYFLAFDSAKAESAGKHWTDRESVLELTHNYGTENDPNYKARFGHICFSVDHLEATCAALETAGVKFQKKLTEGKMRDIAFALDPDGYWVELIGRPSANPEAKETDKETYRFNHTMIRVKDPEKSLLFYQSTLGMSLLRTVENKESKFNLYFLGYRRRGEDGSEVTKEKLADREGLLELTWNYGTESDPNFKYHNGNTDPQGFGHLCISVDSLEDACARFEDLQVNWKKRLTDGRMKTVAFILDPDDYWIEILQNEGLKKSGAGW
ncbi:Glyoxalase/Bleomycin resistance protein/Dihydroxybiphenyl dioxygenase [Sphaerosporella brunnea]|uniref:lactoylglutathione lyase n=1 Tax=Sphaerosporella brunnea TaxID=1250544 RepID=A0A5J5EWQ6_9PEZI|nr:Glyoxalase/Bleomycin resistance protein/Dihydroxybiphenyl dioxygenase [Sphaerosporella brunnea]